MSESNYIFDISEADIEEYACLTIAFSKTDELRKSFKSQQKYDTFFQKIKKVIENGLKDTDVRLEVIDNLFVIRFCKNLSFQSSVMSALKHAINIMQNMAQISYNLKQKKKIKLNCRITILKRSISEEDFPFDAGMDIKNLNDVNKQDFYYSGLQIITDQFADKVLSRKYRQSIIFSSQISNKYFEFYEFPLAQNLEIISEEEKEQNNLSKQDLPQIFADNEEQFVLEDVEEKIINAKSEFIEANEVDLPKILQMLLHGNCFISINHADSLPIMSSYIREILSKSVTTCVSFACHEGYKTEPYAFLKEFLSVLLGIDFNDKSLYSEYLEQLHAFDETDSLFRLFNNEINQNILPDTAHNIYENVFQQIVENIGNIVIFVERFDYCDETSIEFIRKFLDTFAKQKISFVVTVSNQYLLHKDIPELLYIPRYKNITVHKSNFNNLFMTIENDYSVLGGSEYFFKIRSQCQGSVYYFRNVLQYLEETDALIKNENGEFSINPKKMVVIPVSFEQLVKKRFDALSQDEAYLIAYVIFAGGKLSQNILVRMNINNIGDVFESLVQKKMIDIRNGLVFIENADFVSKCIQDHLKNETKQFVIENLEKAGVKVSHQDNIIEIYQKAELAISHGDFNTYLINSKKFLEMLKETTYISPEIKNLQTRIYSVLEQFIDKYPSSKIYPIIKHLQETAIKQRQPERIMDISSKILDSAVMDKNYNLAETCVKYILKQVLDLQMNSETNELQTAYYYYQCMNIKVLFHKGHYEEAIKISEKIMADLENPELREKLESSGILNIFKIVLMYSSVSKVLTCADDLIPYMQKIEGLFSEQEWFGAVVCLNTLLHEDEFPVDNRDTGIAGIINCFVSAFADENISYDSFAKNIHNVKIMAKNKNEIFWELLSDMLIGYCYQKLENNKAIFILEDVKSIAENKGIEFISQLASLFIANYYYAKNDLTKSMEILNEVLPKIKQSSSDNVILDTLYNIFLYNIAIADAQFGINIEHTIYKLNYLFQQHNLGKLGIFIDKEQSQE